MITNSITKIAKEKVEVANKQLNKDMSKETRSILKRKLYSNVRNQYKTYRSKTYV